MTPEDLHARAVAELDRRKAGALRLARHHRQKQTEAKAAGEVDLARQLGMLAAHLEQSAALAEAEMRDRTVRYAKGQRTAKNRDLARRERPGRRPPMHDLMADHLRPLKREGVQFKALMARWERERIGPLRLDDLGNGRYRITDEDGDAEPVEHTRGYIEKLYSKAR